MKKQAEKTKKIQLGKVQKIVIAAVAALLCIATVLMIVISASQHPLEKFAAKMIKKQSFQMDVVLSGIPFFGTVSLTYEMDGNIQHIPAGNFVSESYMETVGDKQYKYTKDETGKWIKAESDENLLSSIQSNETLKQLLNVDNYEKVEGKKNVYRQKADVVFENCKDVTITLEDKSCIIEMIALSNGMALETLIVISNVGKVNLTLPFVAE